MAPPSNAVEQQAAADEAGASHRASLLILGVDEPEKSERSPAHEVVVLLYSVAGESGIAIAELRDR